MEQIRLDLYGEMAENEGADPTQEDVERIADKYGEIEGTTFEDKVLKTEKGNYEIKLSDIWTAGTSTEDPVDPDLPEDAIQAGEIATAGKNAYYSDDKRAVIPEGFTVSNVEGEKTVNGGLVIYHIPEGTDTSGDFWTVDSDGDSIPDVQENYDQYVWIPVDGILGEDGNIEDVNAENVEDRKILLGRYVFDENGNIDTENAVVPETIGGELKISKTDSYYHVEEDSTDTESLLNKGNKIAEDIGEFIQSVRDNDGYYIGRYEAGDADAVANRDDSSKDDNPLVVKRGKYVYNEVTQPQASSLCQNLYEGVNSDLVNSYAFDTAILFIQKYSGDGDYSRQDGYSTTPSSPSKTGEGKLADTDEFDNLCNIYDMAGNCLEWSTETSSDPLGPCVYRGGYYYGSIVYTSNRSSYSTTDSNSYSSFRPLLYL